MNRNIARIMQTWTMVSISGTIDGFYVEDSDLDRVLRDLKAEGKTVYTRRPEDYNAKHISDYLTNHNDRVIPFYYPGRIHTGALDG